MRGHLAVVLLVLVGCGGDDGQGKSEQAGAFTATDGFLHYLPENPSLVARLPTVDRIREDEKAVENLLSSFGYGSDGVAKLLYRAAEFAGIDTARAAGLVTMPDGGWIQYLPASDKGRLNAALRDLVTRYALQEEERWIMVSSGAPGPGRGQGEALPGGDVALRLTHNGLLSAIAQPGDALELGAKLLGGGLEFHGRLVPGRNSPTATAIAAAGGEIVGHLDLLPAALGVRFEATLPPTVYATLLTRRLVRHAGLEAGELRDNLERFLREATTAISPRTGLAVGIEFREGTASFVAVGEIADGPASPVLAKLARARRTTFGGLVLDEREASRGLTGFYAWMPQTEAKIAPPATLAPILRDLLSEETGVHVTFLEAEGYAVVAAGPRADVLARAVRKSVVSGAKGSAGTRQLALLRERSGQRSQGSAECIIGAVVAGSKLDSMPPADRAELRRLLGAKDSAVAPRIIVLAGFRDADALKLEGTLVYE
ncbi:MAG: hypothetical protein ACYTGZ_09100 [Planctomycetota bacterium]|jgi:hypothetical protein